MINNFNFSRLRYSRILTGLGVSLSLILLTSMVTTTDKPITSIDQIISDAISGIQVGDQVGDTIPPYPDVTPWILDKTKTDFTGYHGNVIVSLNIEQDGTAMDIKVVQSAGDYLDQWALNKIKQVKKWHPAMLNDKPVKYRLYYPITFGNDKEIGLENTLAVDPDTIHKAIQNKKTQKTLPNSPPQYPGGNNAQYKFIVSNLVYPEDARKAGIEGTVYVQFIIGPTGRITNAKVLKGVSTSIDKAALDVINKMPDWIPALIDNKPASFEMTMPFKFKLSDDKEDHVAKDTKADLLKSNEKSTPQKIEGSEVFTVVEVAPQFPGGDDARTEFINKNITYPEHARKEGIQGTVYLTFVVQSDGSITHAKVLRGVGGGLDEIALEVVKKMPKWEPGIVKGEPVPVLFNMPIKFKLTKDENKPVEGSNK